MKCVCAGQVWGDNPCLVVWSHVDGFGLFLSAERGRWAISVNFLMLVSRPFALRATLNACPQFLSDPTARGCGIHAVSIWRDRRSIGVRSTAPAQPDNLRWQDCTIETTPRRSSRVVVLMWNCRVWRMVTWHVVLARRL